MSRRVRSSRSAESEANRLFYEVWKYNGGSNYNKEFGYTIFAYTGSRCFTSKSGHGGVFLQGASGNIAGRQRNHC